MSKIYFMKQGEYYKIGISTDPKRRLSCVNVGSPHDTELVTTISVPDDSKYSVGEVESILHSMYSADRVSGEWFNINGKEVGKYMLIDEIDADYLVKQFKSNSAVNNDSPIVRENT